LTPGLRPGAGGAGRDGAGRSGAASAPAGHREGSAGSSIHRRTAAGRDQAGCERPLWGLGGGRRKTGGLFSCGSIPFPPKIKGIRRWTFLPPPLVINPAGTAVPEGRCWAAADSAGPSDRICAEPERVAVAASLGGGGGTAAAGWLRRSPVGRRPPAVRATSWIGKPPRGQGGVGETRPCSAAGGARRATGRNSHLTAPGGTGGHVGVPGSLVGQWRPRRGMARMPPRLGLFSGGTGANGRPPQWTHQDRQRPAMAPNRPGNARTRTLHGRPRHHWVRRDDAWPINGIPGLPYEPDIAASTRGIRSGRPVRGRATRVTIPTA